jgi:LysM repeat protein
MRTTLAAAVAVSLLFATGCEDRQNLRVVPDRHGHAAGTTKQAVASTNDLVASANEQWYTMQKGETMYGVAKKFNIKVGDLIARNKIDEAKVNKIGEGYNLIVPRK